MNGFDDPTICDLCETIGPRLSNIARRYTVLPIGSRTVAGAQVTYGRDWAACSVCESLIERNDRQGLLDRALAVANDRPRAWNTPEHVRVRHEIFWECKRD